LIKPNKESLIDADYLRSVIKYDPETGALSWAKSFGNVIEGSVAGCLKGNGYWIVGLRGEKYLAHRLAWLWMNGAWPTNQIDHINGNKLDNSINNLRDVVPHVNMQNQDHLKRANISGITGVSWKQSKGGWFASISVKGKKIRRGPYNTKERATQARNELKSKHHVDSAPPPAPAVGSPWAGAGKGNSNRGDSLFHGFHRGVDPT
jgi:hypothetical protein